MNIDSKDCLHVTTSSILNTSKSQRQIDPELPVLPSSSDDDLSVDVTANFQRSASVTRISNESSTLTTGLRLSTGVKPKTVLDILNDTIIQSLGTGPTIKTELPIPSLKNVKIEPPTTTKASRDQYLKSFKSH